MKNILRQFAFSLILAAAASTAWAVSPADQKIADGRAALVAHDLVTARLRFTEARALDASNQMAAALLGFTRFFAFVGDPAAQSFMDGAGFSANGRDVYNFTSNIPQDANGEPVLPANYNLQTPMNFLRDSVAPETATIRGHLAAVTDNAFVLTLSAQETTSVSITADKGDILMAQAGLRAFEFFVHFLNGQNLNVDLPAVQELGRGNLLTLPKLLKDNPNLLTAGSSSERAAARAALLDVISLYRQASAFVRGRPVAVGQERMFMLDPSEQAAEAALRSHLADIERSLDGYVVIDGGNEGAKSVTLAPLFTAGFSMRSVFPDPAQPFSVQTFSGSTLGGLLLGASREQAAQTFVEMGFPATIGWSNVNPTPIAESLSKYVNTGTAHILLGNAGTIGRSTDGTNFTYQTLPAQDFFNGAYGAGKIVACSQTEIWRSTDDGLTWAKVLRLYSGIDNGNIGSIAEVIYDGTRFLAITSTGRTYSSADGKNWNEGNSFGNAFGTPNFNGMVYDGSHYFAVGNAGTATLGTRSAIFSSTDGATWSQVFTGPSGASYRAVVAGGGRLIVSGNNGRVAKSTDGGATWAETFVGTSTDTLFATGYGNGTYVVAGPNGRLFTSSDATTWNLLTASATSPTFFDAVGNGADIYLPGSAGSLYRLTGGTLTRLDTNTSLMANRSNAFEEAVQLNGKLYVGGSDGGVYESTNGTSYIFRPTGNSFGLFSLTLHNGVIFAAGNNGTIISSLNGIDWQTRISNNSAITTQTLIKIASVNGQLIAVGNGGTLLTSTDNGTTWLKRTTPTSDTLRCVAYGDGNYMVGTSATFNSTFNNFEGAILTSPNGVNWTRSVIRVGNSANSQPSVRAILRRNGFFLLFLGDGSILHSSFFNGGFTFNHLERDLGVQTAAFESSGVIYSLTARANDEIHSTLNYSLDEGGNWVRTEIPTGVGFFGSTVFGGQIYTFANFGQILRSSVLPAQPRAPVVLSSPAQTVGIGGSIDLGVPIESSESLTYQWSLNGQPISGATAAALSLNNVQAAQAGTYALTVTGAITGAVVSGTVNLSVVAAAPFLIRQPANTLVGTGETLVLEVEATGTGPITYAWFKDGNNLSNNQATLTIPNAATGNAGAYHVTVTNLTGTTTSLDAYVTVADNVPGFWRSVNSPDNQNEFAPTRTVHDGQGHIYVNGFITRFDVGAGRTAGSLVRIDETTGAVDPTFHYDERFGTPFFTAPQPDGKVLVSVLIGAVEGATVIRLNGNGTRDTSFTAPFFDRGIRIITLQGDGKVLFGAAENVQTNFPAGTITAANATVYRLSGANGSLDGGFTPVVLSAGAVLFGPPVVDSTGRIYLVGAFSTVNGTSRKNIARVSSSGVLDSTFGDPNNTAQLPAGFASTQARGLLFQSDGKAVVVGDFRYNGRGQGTYVFNGATFNDRIMAIRFNTDGTFDGTYAQPLRSQLPMNPNLGFRIRYLAMQPDDKLVVVSDALFRLTAGGALDGTFQTTNFSAETFWLSRSPNSGNLYVGNLSRQDAPGGIGAYAANGVPITTFDTVGWGFSSAPNAALALADGRVLAGGSFNHYINGAVSGAALFGRAGNFIPDANSFYHPNENAITPLAQATGWHDGSFLVRESDFGNIVAQNKSSQSTRRFNADGSANTNWQFEQHTVADNAVVTATEPGKLLVWFHQLDDPTIVASGPSTWLRRYNADGSLDHGFMPDLSGLFSINRDGSNNITSVTEGQILQLRPLPDSSMLIAFIHKNGNIYVTKLLPNGQVDEAYNLQSLGSAIAKSPFNSSAFDPVKNTGVDYPVNSFSTYKFADLLALPDGRAYLTGAYQHGTQPYGIARLLANGTPDSSFTGAGLAYTGAYPLLASGTSLGMDDFGRVYLAGRFDKINNVAVAGLARFTAAGALDTSFGPGIEVRADHLTNTVIVGTAGRLHVMGSAALSGSSFTAGYESVPIIGTAPVISGQSGPQNLIGGQTLLLFAGAFGGSGATQQWFRNSVPIAGATSSVFSIPAVTAGDAGNYSFTISNDLGTQSTGNIAVTVVVAPGISTQPQGGSVNIGGSLTLSVLASGTDPLTYQWKKNTNDIGGATGSSYTINGAQLGDAGSYTVLVTNSAGFILSNTATVMVFDGFEVYRSAHFTAPELADLAKSGFGAIYGTDGLTNLVKYALGLDPKVNTTTMGLPELTRDGTNWIYTYTRPSATTDLVYTVEASADLVNWSTANVTHGKIGTSNGVETWQATYPLASAPKIFLRLKVAKVLGPS